MVKDEVIGTCSNCNRKKTPVLRRAGVQLCGYCIEKLEVPKNVHLFKQKGSHG